MTRLTASPPRPVPTEQVEAVLRAIPKTRDSGDGPTALFDGVVAWLRRRRVLPPTLLSTVTT